MLGLGDLNFKLLEASGEITLAAGDGLLADVVLRHAGEMGARDLDVVAKYAGVADLEGRDAGSLAFFGFEGGDGDAGIGGYGAQVFEFLREALADDAACGEGCAGLIGDGFAQQVSYIVMRCD